MTMAMHLESRIAAFVGQGFYTIGPGGEELMVSATALDVVLICAYIFPLTRASLARCCVRLTAWHCTIATLLRRLLVSSTPAALPKRCRTSPS